MNDEEHSVQRVALLVLNGWVLSTDRHPFIVLHPPGTGSPSRQDRHDVELVQLKQSDKQGMQLIDEFAGSI